jgi:hypothetical protein
LHPVERNKMVKDLVDKVSDQDLARWIEAERGVDAAEARRPAPKWAPNEVSRQYRAERSSAIRKAYNDLRKPVKKSGGIAKIERPGDLIRA